MSRFRRGPELCPVTYNKDCSLEIRTEDSLSVGQEPLNHFLMRMTIGVIDTAGNNSDFRFYSSKKGFTAGCPASMVTHFQNLGREDLFAVMLKQVTFSPSFQVTGKKKSVVPVMKLHNDTEIIQVITEGMTGR